MALDRTEKLHEIIEKNSVQQNNSAASSSAKMRPKARTDRFLRAIKKYAKEQKNAMEGEVRQFKTERLKEAREKAQRDSEKLIFEKKEESLTRRTAILATKTQEGQKSCS